MILNEFWKFQNFGPGWASNLQTEKYYSQMLVKQPLDHKRLNGREIPMYFYSMHMQFTGAVNLVMVVDKFCLKYLVFKLMHEQRVFHAISIRNEMDVYNHCSLDCTKHPFQRYMTCKSSENKFNRAANIRYWQDEPWVIITLY